MKKFLVLTCMIACVFGMTACSEDKPLTAYEQKKVDAAIVKAETEVIPAIQKTLNNPDVAVIYEYTPEEVEDNIRTTYKIEVDGNAFISALGSFEGTYEEIGGEGEIKGSTVTIDGKQIVVNVNIDGPNHDAIAEIIFTNDGFLELESAALNKVDTMSEAMEKAGLNTVLGMGTVFVVLILISLIISCLGLVSKVQSGEKKPEVKEAPKSETASSIEKTVAQIAVQEEIAATDDLELVAVIAAAIAASQGQASADGFVVRSIKRRRA